MALLSLGDTGRMGWTSAQKLRITGTVFFYKDDGSPLSVQVNGGAPTSQFQFSINPSEILYLDVASSISDTAGWALIAIDDNGENDSDWGMMDGQDVMRGDRLSATVFYAARDGGGQLLSRVGVVPSLYEMGRFFTSVLPAELQSGLNTGVAIVNTSAKDVSVTLRIKDSKGQVVATKTFSLQKGRQTARFIDELFAGAIPRTFQGSLEVVAQNDGIVTMGLILSQGILTSIPTHHYGTWTGNGMMR
jgi:hypothetical protein